MKFGKLLAAGKSWVGGNGIGRYQMRDGLHLPKFISPKNPFKQEPAAGSVAPSIAAAAPAMPKVEALPVSIPTPAPNVTVVSSQPAAEPAAAKIPLRVRGLRLAQALSRFARHGGEWLKRVALFCLDHNPFSAIGKPKLAGIPRFGKQAEQGELSLDRVKVVRNDLSHADLEVVGQK